MPDFALELSLDASSDSAVRDCWAALKAGGLPSQADHRGMTNAPHLTLVAAERLDESLCPITASAVGPFLPAPLTVHGIIVLGQGSRVTLAFLAEPDAALATAVARVRRQLPPLRHPVWIPHITLARGLPRSSVPTALELLEPLRPRQAVANRLRWWDPHACVIRTLVQA